MGTKEELKQEQQMRKQLEAQSEFSAGAMLSLTATSFDAGERNQSNNQSTKQAIGNQSISQKYPSKTNQRTNQPIQHQIKRKPTHQAVNPSNAPRSALSRLKLRKPTIYVYCCSI